METVYDILNRICSQILVLANNYAFTLFEMDEVNECLQDLKSKDFKICLNGSLKALELLRKDDVRKSKIIPHLQRSKLYNEIKQCNEFLSNEFGNVEDLMN